jgi:hypothetical protein
LGAVSVALPTDQDLKDSKTVETSTIEAAVTDMPTFESLWNADTATNSRTAAPFLKYATEMPSELSTDLRFNDQPQHVASAVKETSDKLDPLLDKTLSDKLSRPSLTLVNREWNLVFATRQEGFSYLMENEAYIESTARLSLEDTGEILTDFSEDEGIARAFMQPRDSFNIDLPAYKVEAFCFSATLEELKARHAHDKVAAAWLDERSFFGRKRTIKNQTRPLNSKRPL